MAIPGIPSNVLIQTANQTNLVSWNISTGATSYSVQRSTDGVTFSTVSSPTVTSYLDSSVTLGVQYWYQVASINTSGTSPYAIPGLGNQTSVIPTPNGEMSLQGIRFAAQQKADRVSSNFVSLPEYTTYVGLAMNELYDLLVTVYEDYFMAPRVQFLTVANTSSASLYALPNGSNTFINAATQQSFTPAPFYKMLGVDLGLNNANNSFVTVNKYNFIDRNKYIYPNTASTIYSAFNLQYRVMGTNIELIPSPSAGQLIQLCYIPRLPQLLQDTDITTIGFSGWLNYVITRVAKYVLDKEESDTSKLDAELIYLKSRIEETAANRDAGQPDRISNTRQGDWGGGMGGGYGFNGSIGGW